MHFITLGIIYKIYKNIYVPKSSAMDSWQHSRNLLKLVGLGKYEVEEKKAGKNRRKRKRRGDLIKVEYDTEVGSSYLAGALGPVWKEVLFFPVFITQYTVKAKS